MSSKFVSKQIWFRLVSPMRSKHSQLTVDFQFSGDRTNQKTSTEKKINNKTFEASRYIKKDPLKKPHKAYIGAERGDKTRLLFLELLFEPPLQSSSSFTSPRRRSASEANTLGSPLRLCVLLRKLQIDTLPFDNYTSSPKNA